MTKSDILLSKRYSMMKLRRSAREKLKKKTRNPLARWCQKKVWMRTPSLTTKKYCLLKLVEWLRPHRLRESLSTVAVMIINPWTKWWTVILWLHLEIKNKTMMHQLMANLIIRQGHPRRECRYPLRFDLRSLKTATIMKVTRLLSKFWIKTKPIQSSKRHLTPPTCWLKESIRKTKVVMNLMKMLRKDNVSSQSLETNSS